MTSDTKRQLSATGATVLIIAAALTGGVYLADKKIAAVVAPAPKTITIRWDTLPEAEPGLAELWVTTNLVTWQLLKNFDNNNSVTLPNDKPMEFFKVRLKTYSWFKQGTNAAFTNWFYTDWALTPKL